MFIEIRNGGVGHTRGTVCPLIEEATEEMSLKVRCSQCQKKISVDEAFAGSMCRCPYCKLIVRVPHLHSGAGGAARPNRPGARPSRPGAPRTGPVVGSGLKHTSGSRPIVGTPDKRPQRPVGPTIIKKSGVPQVPQPPGESPPVSPPVRREVPPNGNAPIDESQLTAEQLASIPTANPVFLQGVVSLILLGVLLVVGGATAYLGVQVFSGKTGNDHDSAYLSGEEPQVVEELSNPFLVSSSGPKVCGVSITAPVVYLIDGGAAMGDLYLYARDAMRASVLSLPDGESFGVVVAGEDKAQYIGSKMYPGGATGEKQIRPRLQSIYDGDSENPSVEIGGASDLARGVDAALALKPKTLVLFVRNTEIPDPADMGKSITAAGARLVLVAFGSEYDEQENRYNALVKAAGETAKRVFYDADYVLQSYYDEKNLPE